MSEWPLVPISDIASIVLGGTPSRNNPDYWNGDIPWATAKDVTSTVGRYIYMTEESITQLGLEESAAKLLPKGTIVITARGTVGAVAQLGTEMAFNQTCYGLVAKPQVEQDYLFYAIKGSLYEMQSLTYGTVFNTITMASFDHWKIPIPPLPEQRAIAHILGTLDDKIELNRRMNETLEAIARAIFKSWFVDFDPVIDNALKAGKPIPNELEERAVRRREVLTRTRAEGRPTGLPQHLARLFPDEFEEGELGWIPRGWNLRGLDKIANYLNGLALQKYPPEGKDSLPVIKIAQLRKGNTEGADRASSNIPNEYVVNDGDVLFAWSGSLEVDIWCGGCGALNQHLFKVTSEQFPKWFYYLWIKHYLPIFRGIAADKATTMGHIQRHHLAEAKAIVPPPRLLEEMDRFLAPVLDMLVYKRIESRTLAALRDALLPKLVSGELRVKDAERAVEVAL
ncbi:MAG: restriction endonuclease subunit S [Synergistales bacterium]|nr:restriction endonuclease subunit S [Synergistales bacterium]